MNLDAIPRLSPGCRLNELENTLLIPEGMLRLSGPSPEILALIDGKRSLLDIIQELHGRYPSSNQDAIEIDISKLLTRLHQRGFIRI